MAVADDDKVEKADKVAKVARGQVRSRRARRRPRLAGRASSPRRGPSCSEVRAELKKVTWPSRKEVYSTTLVVIATSIFFGFYLWGLDLVFSRALSLAFKRQF